MYVWNGPRCVLSRGYAPAARERASSRRGADDRRNAVLVGGEMIDGLASQSSLSPGADCEGEPPDRALEAPCLIAGC